jgi:hypothetical protein
MASRTPKYRAPTLTSLGVGPPAGSKLLVGAPTPPLVALWTVFPKFDLQVKYLIYKKVELDPPNTV